MTHLSDFDENFDNGDGDWEDCDVWDNESIEINHIFEYKTNDLPLH